MLEFETVYVGGWTSPPVTHKIETRIVRTELNPDDLVPLVHIEDIRDSQCRWPTQGHMWCGRQTDGSVYCEEHHKRAKQ